jgi:dTDP-4-amino-4,6-dideoxygalactose transaminase
MSSASDVPALLGGTPVRPAGPPEWPVADEAIRDALEAAWRDGSWGRYFGGHVERLEARLAADHGVAHALTCGSGTFAVELALRALKVGPGAEVVLAAYDYPGNFLAVHAVGARPVLADVDPQNASLAVPGLAEAFTEATRAVIVSHLHGGLAAMRELMELAAQRAVRVIEDAAQAPEAWVQGRRAGTWGDVGVLSFGGSKLLTAGRGGAFLTRHADVAQRARVALVRGNHVCPLSELQAAVLAPQLDRLDEDNARRRRAVELLQRLMGGVPGMTLFRNSRGEDEAVYYKVGFHFEPEAFGLDRARFVAAARAEGVAFDEGFQALHMGRSPSRWRGAGSLKEAERAGRDIVVLHHPVLLGSEAEVAQVAAAVHKIKTFAAELSTCGG